MGVRSSVSSWEAELWHYISSGDGISCPLYNQCQIARECGWCISEHREHIERDTRHFNPNDYDFLEQVTPGRLFQLVEKLAYRLVKKGRVDRPPVPTSLAYMADDQHPVEIRLIPLKTHRAGIWHLKDSWVIQLNENDSPAGRRFTLFHEIFHVLAHLRASPVFRQRGREAGSFNEMVADYFASCVLMPGEWVKEKWAEVKNIRRMAEIFDVPESTMWIRLKLLHLI